MPDAAPLIETARLVLGPLRREDFEDFHTMWTEPTVVQYITGAPATREESWMRLLRNTGLWPLLGYGTWAVHDRVSGRFAGSIGFADFHRQIEPSIEGIPEAGWVFAAWAHGAGRASEALTACLEWLDRSGFEHSVCLIDPANTASLKLAEKHGYAKPSLVQFCGHDTALLSRPRC